TIGETHHTKLIVSLPIYNFVGYGLNLVQLVILLVTTGLLGALLVSLSHAATSLPLTKLLKKERAIPFLLFLLSYILPWSIEDGYYFSYIGQQYSSRAYAPAINLEYITTNPGITILNFRFDWYMLVFQLLLFWIPASFMLMQIVYTKPHSMNLGALLPSVIPAAFGLLVILIPTSNSPSVGAYIALIAFIIVILQVIYKSKFAENRYT
ncbi:MAG: hypothetical protein ACFFEV_03455, partial [Candidatus Thorarchaeota archaeon]